MQLPELPVSAVLSELNAALQAGCAVLSAPPGAGKTTLVPPYLLGHRYAGGGRIIMLEPRRVAARAAAMRIASLLGEQVGETVGYRVRGDVRVGPDTRIEVMTEGMLTALLRRDPALEKVKLVIFDEFHERNLAGDLALALVSDIRSGLRDDLDVLVMSATLEAERVAALLDGAPVVAAPGRMFPVEVHWSGAAGDVRDLPGRMAAAIRQLLPRESGSFLAFLPGAREIEETAAQLADLESESLRVVPLYGALDKREQDEAIAPPAPGRRKVVLATNLAESSLTIEGVRVVLDSGLERRMRFAPGSGLARLECTRISRASAEQRAGRAGRLEPGAVYRFWTELEHRALPERPVPEVLDCDLAPLALQLADWGAAPEQLRWLDPVPVAGFEAARELLRLLGLLDGAGQLTPAGRRAAALAIHPRLAAMLIEAEKRDLLPLAAELAALLEERDPTPRAPGADIEYRLEKLRSAPRQLRQHLVIRDQLLQAFRAAYRPQDGGRAGELLTFAYPDRVAQSRGVPGVHYLLSGGRGARLLETDDLRQHPMLVAADVDGLGAAARIQLAAPLDEADFAAVCGDRFTEVEVVAFDREKERVTAMRETRFGSLVVRRAPLGAVDPGEAARVLAEAVNATGLHVLRLDAAALALLERVRFAAARDPENWPDWSEAALPGRLEEWISGLPEARSFADLGRADWRAVLEQQLGYAAKSRLEREYPERFEVPTGSRLRIDYSAETPVLRVRVQELYGVRVHPALGGGRFPLKLELLSPAQRPIQITSDLPRFWRENWELVRREMRAAYPKHVWPEDPANAAPTTRAKPRPNKG